MKGTIGFAVSKIPALRMTISNILKHEGFLYIHEFKTGMTAVSEYIKIKPDIVIADDNFDDITGLELFQQIKIKNQDAKFIVLGETKTQLIEQIIEMNGKYVQKPVNTKVISEIINGFDDINQKKDFDNTIMIVAKLINIRHQIKKTAIEFKLKAEDFEDGNLVFDKLNLKKYTGIIYDKENSYLKVIDFLKKLRVKDKDIKVAILTNKSFDPDEVMLKVSGANSMLHIPIDTNEIKNLLKNWTDDE